MTDLATVQRPGDHHARPTTHHQQGDTVAALFRHFDPVVETDVRVASYDYGAGRPGVGVQITLEHNGVTMAARLPKETARDLAAAISAAIEAEARP